MLKAPHTFATVGTVKNVCRSASKSVYPILWYLTPFKVV